MCGDESLLRCARLLESHLYNSASLDCQATHGTTRTRFQVINGHKLIVVLPRLGNVDGVGSAVQHPDALH